DLGLGHGRSAAQPVQAQPGGDGGQPGGEVLDVLVRALQPQPGLLDDVLRLARVRQDACGERDQARPVPFELRGALLPASVGGVAGWVRGHGVILPGAPRARKAPSSCLLDARAAGDVTVGSHAQAARRAQARLSTAANPATSVARNKYTTQRGIPPGFAVTLVM